jgi:hypothetical protein
VSGHEFIRADLDSIIRASAPAKTSALLPRQKPLWTFQVTQALLPVHVDSRGPQAPSPAHLSIHLLLDTNLVTEILFPTTTCHPESQQPRLAEARGEGTAPLPYRVSPLRISQRCLERAKRSIRLLRLSSTSEDTHPRSRQVSGHEFIRAESDSIIRGFSPCAFYC